MSRWFFALGLASIFGGACVPEAPPKSVEESSTVHARTETLPPRVEQKPVPASAPLEPSRVAVSAGETGLEPGQVDFVAARMAFQGQLAARVERLDTRRGELAREYASASEEMKERVKPLLEQWMTERKQLERAQNDLVLTTNEAWDAERDRVGTQATALEDRLTEMERLLDKTASTL